MKVEDKGKFSKEAYICRLFIFLVLLLFIPNVLESACIAEGSVEKG